MQLPGAGHASGAKVMAGNSRRESGVCRTNTDIAPPTDRGTVAESPKSLMARSVSVKLKSDIRRLVKAIESLREVDPASAREVERMIRSGFTRRRRRPAAGR